jgi:hypothetical protein
MDTGEFSNLRTSPVPSRNAAIENSPQFQLRVRGTQIESVPQGRLKLQNWQWRKQCDARSATPAGLVHLRWRPGGETPGYFHLCLRHFNSSGEFSGTIHAPICF